ncbi:phosphodiester glycosidase family protein [Macrococcoides caseolyticum]|uniref:phosphodiester glycosidase family protein n=1 Tax=Macrococcoides caseolyticum TaxID=69966 RepID=UPI00105B30D6|nr:phosphodiester glycosidase family protein [Macrococcus caseolyticus]TDM23315.1 phosphodiester glycosidase family protein [Macrococcus caseolyticus]
MVIRNIYTGRGNRENVNGVNSNFAYLFGEMSNLWGFVNGKGDEILSSEAIQEMISRWIDKNDFKPKEAVATFNDLPKEAELKEIRGVTDENAVYVYDGEKWIKQSRLNFDGLDDVKKNIFYNEIVTRSYRDEVSSTDYWVTVIPFQDENGDKIEIKKGTTDKSEGETPREFFERTGSSFVVNASIFNGGGLYGIHIKDGEIYKDTPSKYEILGITKDREFKYYPSDTTSDTMLKDNVYNSFTGFASILKNGQELPLESFAKVGSYSETHPRVVVGTNTNKDLYVIVTDGRKSNNIGMTYEDITRISKSLNLMDAYSLDGGGSAQAIHNGNFIGGLIDNNLTTERKVYDFLYVPKKSSREIDSQVNTIAENSVRLKKIENNYIDRRMPVFDKESTFKAKSYFEDYFYVLEGKALYNKSIDDFSRLIGAIAGYNYVGSDKKHLHLEAKSKLTASVEGSSYTVSLIPNNPVWKTPSFTNGWKSDGTIKGKYIKVGDIVTITGYFLGTAGNFTKPIFYIDEGYRPKQQITFAVPVMGGSKEYNTLTINPNGSVSLAHDISTSNGKSGVQVHVSYTVL